jgi:Cu(I)/Ag(I) efflux system membrane fusion protein
VRVRIGIETGGQVEILSGLREGDKVVVSAQFLIDSESSLQASFRRMTAH